MYERQVGEMRVLVKRPTLLLWVTIVAMFLARVAYHGNHGRGFHQW